LSWVLFVIVSKFFTPPLACSMRLPLRSFASNCTLQLTKALAVFFIMAGITQATNIVFALAAILHLILAWSIYTLPAPSPLPLLFSPQHHIALHPYIQLLASDRSNIFHRIPNSTCNRYQHHASSGGSSPAAQRHGPSCY
jgi:hypothetical protein